MVPESSSFKNLAMTSTNSTLTGVPALQPILEKLTRSNLPISRALVVSALKGAQLSEILEGKVVAPKQTLASDDKKVKMPNPKSAIFITEQQQVLNFLLSSLSKEMLEHVAVYSTPEEVWENLM
jgi:hypothetical protein